MEKQHSKGVVNVAFNGDEGVQVATVDNTQVR